MKKLVTAFICAAMLLSCGESHKAKSTVNAFLKDNLKSEEYSVTLFGLDSTYHVTDSSIYSVRQRVSQFGIYKDDVTFADRDPSGKLLFLRGKIIMGKDTFRQTFYLNPNLEDVVAVKEN